MAPRIGPSDAERYGWPGASAATLAETCTPIARQIVRARVRTVGFIPAAGTVGGGRSLAPLIAAVGEALLGFVTEEIGIIDSWPTWPWGAEVGPDLQSIYRQRRLAPRIVEMAPLPCGDPQAAAIALRAVLETRPSSLAITMVNLSDYARPGVVPSAEDLFDGIVLVAGRGRTLSGGVARMARHLAAQKNLGAVLIG